MYFPARAVSLIAFLSIAPGLAAGQSLKLVQIADGLGTPTDAVFPAGDQRLFVPGSDGRIWVLENGVRRSQPFLDISGLTYPNQGISSMAFHPDYATNGRFFLTYLDVNEEAVLAEYHVSADPNVADAASAIAILGPYPQINNAHNWNTVRFGPDGMLYVATGDGGATHVENQAQNLGSLNGKVLRLDVDLPAPYVPADNPFVGDIAVREEVFMLGLRQPWKMTFDSATGDMYIADVGRHDMEEVNYVAAADLGGQNFGWRCHEGPTCTNFENCPCGHPDFTMPIHWYDHLEGCAVIGGEVYRGSQIPSLVGEYVFADHCTGRIWSMRVAGGSVAQLVEHTAEFVPLGEAAPDVITAIAVAPDGELLVLDRDGGKIFRIVAEPMDRYCVALQHSAGGTADMVVTGSGSVALNDLQLGVADGIPNSFGIFFHGSRRVLQPFGDGLRCAGGATQRVQPVIQMDALGAASRPYDLTHSPPGGLSIASGDTWNFQFWFRDAMGTSGFSTSDAVTVTFFP